MKDPYVESLAAHTRPGSYVVGRESNCEALTEVCAGPTFSLEGNPLRGANAMEVCKRALPAYRQMARDPGWHLGFSVVVGLEGADFPVWG